MAKPKVTISLVRSEHDCDDCGGYTDSDASVYVNGCEVVRARHDGHLGGGNWCGRRNVLLTWALAALGCEVRVNGEVPEWHTPYGKNDYSSGAREWVEKRLFPTDRPTVVDLRVTEEVGVERRVSIEALEGAVAAYERVYPIDEYGCVTRDEDDGCFGEHTLRALLTSVADVSIEELHAD